MKQHQDFREFISSNGRIVIDQQTNETQKLLQSTGFREKYRGDWGVMKHFFFIALQAKRECKLDVSCVTSIAPGHSLKLIC